jgi:prepilin-type N-terminal cleavage/methylation domain-containing protein/prepilin-type processing-associated H-X9-DG protein
MVIQTPISRRSIRAFTLVELLVVIGIIAVLIGILLPVLSNARRQGNLVKCSSAMRQIAYAFTLYSKENKDKYPTLKWTPWVFAGENAAASLYWNDFLLPYLSRSAGTNKQNMGAGTDDKANEALQRAKASILWSCPEWQGSFAGPTTPASWIDRDGKVVFETGYGYNVFPFYDANFTVAKYSNSLLPVDSPTGQGIPSSTTVRPVYYTYKKWNPYATRCLVTETNLWFMWVMPTDPNTHQVLPMPADRSAQTLPATAGWNNIDRYRHGKYPRLAGNVYDDKARSVIKFNMLYADGHVDTILDMKAAYRGFILRDP